MRVDEARTLWNAQPGWLNTASYGLPPQPAWDALQAALADWRVGATSWEGWDEATAAARAGFARLIGVPHADVAVGSQVSQLIAPVAGALPDGSRVVVPAAEFTSILFPWLVHSDRLQVMTVPTGELVETVAAGCDVVAFSLVQSASGEVARYAEVVAAARSAGAMVVVDASQACGWLPFDGGMADVVVVAGYKWLMNPRGTAYAYLSPAVRERLRPIAAGWYAGADVHASFYGPRMQLAEDARRFDVSPAWFSWVGAAPAIALLERIGLPAIHRHNVALANRFLRGLGHPPGDSAIVTVDAPDAATRLAQAGIRAAVRAGRVRASFHLYTTEADVDLALDALNGRSTTGTA
ncbi:aminotransferase class V [Virgisporangium aliadipatigenens]|uniref:Aminotransferase class V n=1 Tax=Virgisporangium aliadipatigenens TaxID=741659 RepID=A0A8J3YHZ9_9ACTN|nr:aminotransferase class V-fold PLP-dependent enzyme [Virgisporangium aliadipatigenens]GIJ44301.1 aminotransferase class V [Virgisporangium aliadipatigenens]